MTNAPPPETTACRVPEGHRWDTNGRCEWCDAELIDIFTAESDPTSDITDDTLVEGDLTTGQHVRHGVYNRRTKVFHVLTGDPESDAEIRTNAKNSH